MNSSNNERDRTSTKERRQRLAWRVDAQCLALAFLILGQVGCGAARETRPVVLVSGNAPVQSKTLQRREALPTADVTVDGNRVRVTAYAIYECADGPESWTACAKEPLSGSTLSVWSGSNFVKARADAAGTALLDLSTLGPPDSNHWDLYVKRDGSLFVFVNVEPEGDRWRDARDRANGAFTPLAKLDASQFPFYAQWEAHRAAEQQAWDEKMSQLQAGADKNSAAIKELEPACDGGNGEACHELAQRTGSSLEYNNKGCAVGYQPSCDALRLERQSDRQALHKGVADAKAEAAQQLKPRNLSDPHDMADLQRDAKAFGACLMACASEVKECFRLMPNLLTSVEEKSWYDKNCSPADQQCRTTCSSKLESDGFCLFPDERGSMTRLGPCR